MAQTFTFAGRGSFVETPATAKNLETIISLISEVKQLYFDSFKDIHYVVNQPMSKHYPKFTLDETKEPPSLVIDVRFETLQLKLTDIVRKAFKTLEEKLRITSRRDPIPGNIIFSYTGGVTGNLPQIRTSIFILPGYYVCPRCNMYIDDTTDNQIEWDGETLAVCPRTFEHGDVYFTDSVLGKSISDWQVLKYELGEGLTIYQMDNNSMQHRRIARELLQHAKLEESSFKSISYNPNDNTRVFILARDGMPIGYAYWNNFGKDNKRVIRQLFVMSADRGGTGKKLMKATVDLEAPGDKRFSVESPNTISTQMLISLGYAKRNGEGLQGIKCAFVHGA